MSWEVAGSGSGGGGGGGVKCLTERDKLRACQTDRQADRQRQRQRQRETQRETERERLDAQRQHTINSSLLLVSPKPSCPNLLSPLLSPLSQPQTWSHVWWGDELYGRHRVGGGGGGGGRGGEEDSGRVLQEVTHGAWVGGGGGEREMHTTKATHNSQVEEFKSASFNGTSTGASINGRPFLNIPKLWMDGSTPRGRRIAKSGGGGGGQRGGDEEGGEVTSVTISYESSRLALPFMLEVCVLEREIEGEGERERARAHARGCFSHECYVYICCPAVPYVCTV